MRAKISDGKTTLRAIAGTHSVLLAMDLAEAARPGCLGFSIERTDIDTGARRWLPNMLRFKADPDAKGATTARAPLQRFRWGDYTTDPKTRYRYRVVPRYGSPADVIRDGLAAEAPGSTETLGAGVAVEVTTEDDTAPGTSVIFNRGAAASDAYVRKFGDKDPAVAAGAKAWLSRGLEEALLAFLTKATDAGWTLHAAVYEFQKPELLAGLKAAAARKATVEVVYHARRTSDEAKRDAEAAKKGGPPASTLKKNQAAIAAAGLTVSLTPRDADPQGAIMHDKYVVLLKGADPVAVWTGSTNWTEGAIYGQLNVGHAVYDAAIAKAYEKSFQLLKQNLAEGPTRDANLASTPPPGKVRGDIPSGVTPILSPQHDLDMLDLYADVCRGAKLLMVSAPFALHPKIRDALESQAGPDVLRFVMADTEKSYGKTGSLDIMNRDPGFVGTVATVLKTPLNDFQGALLEDRESFHHAGVHVHSKIIAADPLGDDPILITGSANFSENSTTINDSNSLVFRGAAAVTDIYVAEFMRMFEHYWFRFKQSQAPVGAPLGLTDDDSWSTPFYVAASREERDRLAFVGDV